MNQTAANKKIAIIGLGNMGNGMAQTLIRKGFSLVGIDLGEAQRAAAAAIGVEIVDSVRALCEQSSDIILSLPMAKHVQAVINGPDGLLEHARENSLIIDTTTSEPQVTRELAARLKEHGHYLLDCPVSGGPTGAAAGTMVIVAGGEKIALDRAMPLLYALSSKVVHLGDSGNGHVAKLINNLLCAAHLVSTSEAIALGRKAGLDPETLIEGLNAGSGRSAISEVNFPRWILNDQFDSGFTMGLMRKDLRLAQQLIDEMDMAAPLALSEQVTTIWADSENAIDADQDFNCIVKQHLS